MQETTSKKSKKAGKVIVIEGASDGIGKTTQNNLLKEHLKRDNITFTSHHFPTYYSYQGKPVEKYLAGDYGKPAELSPYFVNSLYANDRAITWHMKLQPAYQKGHLILLDRYTTSSLIYQSAFFENQDEKIQFLDFIADYEYHKLGTKSPDQVIFLYAPLEAVTHLREERKNNLGVSHDVHERDLELLAKVYDNSMFVAKYFNWTLVNCWASGDTMRTPEDIHAEIYQKLQPVIQELKK